ncbi:uncharacterized protein ATC70_003186 [Mucor velutinosus]|uniref:BED-type domain-containing protein n=1 Tax=Mucor velutinosus TaxID=708070 RepID=A0AAN7DB87_9FUNG|nr:hypothetical protein ATC70_003186 [Mucor velutinosus]
MPRPLSDSWQYFELLSPDNGRSKKARCSFCGHEQAAGITRLHQHLLYRCSRISSEIRNQLRQKQDDRGHDTPVPHRNDLLHSQPSSTVNYQFDPTLQNILNSSPTSALNTHSNYFDAALSPTTSTAFSTANPLSFAPNTDSINQQQQQQYHHTQQQPSQQQRQPDRSQAMLDWHLARALFSANIPFDKIENPHIIEFFKRLQPNYVLPKARRLQQFLLKEQHWDLIQGSESNAAQQMPSPPTPTSSLHATSQQHVLQQRQNNVGRLGLPPDGNTVSINNNNISNNTALGSRLLASIHPPAELEGSL